MSNKKIGLLNLQYIDNYGANLIAFAMESVCSELFPDYTVQTINRIIDEEIINSQAYSFSNMIRLFGVTKGISTKLISFYRIVRLFVFNNLITKTFKKFIKFILKTPSISPADDPIATLSQKRLSNFQNFRNQHLHMTDPFSDERFMDEDFGAIIVGSDVVWKPQRLLAKTANKTFFLQTNRNFKKIAYAASLGVSDEKQLKRLAKRYKKSISHFNSISIREFSTTSYIQSIIPEKKVYNCIDPVFLCRADKYENLIEQQADNDKYIYAYILGKNENAINYVNRLAEEKSLKICYHSNSSFKNGNNTYADGPCEFLQRIKNAEYVITDSFHGTAFSIIFKKQFYSFTRGVLSVRLENFMSQIGMKDRLLSSVSDETDIDSEIPYDDVFEKIDDWVKSSKEFLKEAIYQEDKNENCCNNANKTEQ